MGRMENKTKYVKQGRIFNLNWINMRIMEGKVSGFFMGVAHRCYIHSFRLSTEDYANIGSWEGDCF